MIKTVIISVVTLVVFSSFIGFNFTNGESKNKLEIPDDSPFTFSYDMSVKTYSTLENDDDIDKLKPHLRFQFVPQERKFNIQFIV